MRRMIIAVLAVAGLAGSAFGQGPDAALIEKVERRFAEVQTMQAAFTQRFYDAGSGQTIVSKGTVKLKKPLLMRWEYRSPEPQTILSDGKKLYMHIPADKQALAQPVENALNSRSPALFLAGGARLSALFRITVVPAPGDSTITDITLSLEPKERSLTVTRIVARFSAADLTIAGFTLYDWTGNRSDVAFADVTVNAPVADAVFVWNRPKGTEVIEAPRY